MFVHVRRGGGAHGVGHVHQFQNFGVVMNFDRRQVRDVVAPLAPSYLKFLQALRRVPQQIPDGLVVDLEDRNRNDVLNGVSSPFFGLDEEVVEGPQVASAVLGRAVHGVGLARACVR